MKKIVATLALFLVFACGEAFAGITPAPNLIPIETALKKAGSDTLVIFDVDDVLLQPKDQLLKMQNKPYLEEIEKEVETRLPKTKVQELYSLIFIHRQIEPVDKKLISLVIKTQKKGIKTLALTNCFTGSFGKISSMQNWRIQELTRLGYHLDQSWAGFKEKVFDKLPSKEPNRFPIFKQGVIFTSSASKGEVLKAFLSYVDFTPKKILFIDDKKKESVYIKIDIN